MTDQPIAPAPAAPPAPEGAQIYDQGYRRYEGGRNGVLGAQRSLVRYSLRHAIGLGRPARYKLLPLAVIVIVSSYYRIKKSKEREQQNVVSDADQD